MVGSGELTCVAVNGNNDALWEEIPDEPNTTVDHTIKYGRHSEESVSRSSWCQYSVVLVCGTFVLRRQSWIRGISG